ncbi:hypothetical protein [Pantoea vagans]|uniref:hypothetical protein n=1 Tax=Pantoea vagans TaxID=470934 RepID=UPI0023B1BD65|nr:hypothetical protein [Pantoea vagans]MDE8559337.1 hypothetical protein [Pantoea vagans]MDE8579337.1 hypothetical protein [Pantoea vagans]
MSDFLSDPRVLLGTLLGFILSGTVWIIAGRITAAGRHSEKWKVAHRDSLLRKLQAAGYSAYSPLILAAR